MGWRDGGLAGRRAGGPAGRRADGMAGWWAGGPAVWPGKPGKRAISSDAHAARCRATISHSYVV